MKFDLNKVYHVYNRGNNKQPIFYNDENYSFFLRKVNILLVPNCEILAYCLMPNHFHFLIYSNEMTTGTNEKGRNNFSEAVRKLLSQYTRAINNQENRSSSLFQQNTNAREIPCHDNCATANDDSILNCFLYIHNNPKNIIHDLSEWRYSSFVEYKKNLNFLCNKELAYQLLDASRYELAHMLE